MSNPDQTPKRTVLPPLNLVFKDKISQDAIRNNTPKGNPDGTDGNLSIPPYKRTVHIAPLDLSAYYLHKSPSATSEKLPSVPSGLAKKEAFHPHGAPFSSKNEPATSSSDPHFEPSDPHFKPSEPSAEDSSAGSVAPRKNNEEGLDRPATTTYEDKQPTKSPCEGFSGASSVVVSGSGSEIKPLVSLFEILGFIEGLPDNLTKIALDIETFVPGEEARDRKSRKKEGRKGSALDWQVARIRLVSLTTPDSGTVVIDLGAEREISTPLWLAVRALLTRIQRVEIVGHRLGFDLCFLEHEFGWRPLKVWDTWVAEELLLNDDWELCNKILRPKKTSPGPASLGNTLKRRLDIDLDKGLGGGALSDFGLPILSAEQYGYSADDTGYLIELGDRQRVDITQAGLERIAGLEMELVTVMSHTEIVGIPLRADILDEELLKFKEDLDEIDRQILSAMEVADFDPFLNYGPVSKTYLKPPGKSKSVNVNGSNFKQHYFHVLERRLKIKLPRTERSRELQYLVSDGCSDDGFATIKEDQISLTAEVLRSIDDPVARLYADREEMSTLITGIEQRRSFIGPDGRVHPIHNQLSANTGRISTEGPPMSNLPKSNKGSPLRRAVEAPEGYVLVQGDLGLIEVRAQAHFTGEPTMIELFNLPPGDPRGDIYRLFASWVESCPVEQIPAKGPLRNQAKPPVLGTAYLMGVNTFITYARGYGVELTVKRAEELRALYFRKFSGIEQWHNRAWSNARANRITEGRSHLGRRRLVLPLVHGDTTHQYRQAQAQVNYIIQAACADGLKIAIALIVKSLPEGAELILTVHDELLVLCRIELAQEVSKIVTEKVIVGYREALGEPLRVPIVFETNIIKNWSEK
jgi:DNA polymerase I-like protein with 3'-5' exonuclease and polymerase domains